MNTERRGKGYREKGKSWREEVMRSGGWSYRSLALHGRDRSVFAGDEDGARDLYVEFFGVVALVYGDAYAASGVDVQEGVAHGNVHEGLAIGEGYGLLVDLEGDSVADYVA